MANKLQWDARPTAADVFATGAGLKNAAATALLIAAADVANGTALNTHADFLLMLNNFDDHPHAGDNVELHIIYEFDTTYGDSEDGDVAGTPRLSGNTLVGIFPVYGTAVAGDENQTIQLTGVPIGPHDFRVVLQLRLSHDLADENDHYLKIFTYCLESQ
jgi:hypothetical protein